MVIGAPLAPSATFGGSVNNMVKCFWCGAENERHGERCCDCGRKLQWTTFFKGVLRPSVGCLLGSKETQLPPERHTVPLRTG